MKKRMRNVQIRVHSPMDITQYFMMDYNSQY